MVRCLRTVISNIVRLLPENHALHSNTDFLRELEYVKTQSVYLAPEMQFNGWMLLAQCLQKHVSPYEGETWHALVVAEIQNKPIS